MSDADLIAKLDEFLAYRVNHDVTHSQVLQELRLARLHHRIETRLHEDARRQANTLQGVASLLDEAAGHVRAMMFTPLGEERQVRHWLPDELEGSALILRDEALKLRGVPDDCMELFQ